MLCKYEIVPIMTGLADLSVSLKVPFSCAVSCGCYCLDCTDVAIGAAAFGLLAAFKKSLK